MGVEAPDNHVTCGAGQGRRLEVWHSKIAIMAMHYISHGHVLLPWPQDTYFYIFSKPCELVFCLKLLLVIFIGRWQTM